ncbi:hypothetical protein [Pseudonocardia charpentierae]|uniref:Uncharacterized protein n=1 Tax=Pseudonocardia charpentierae TaxID=3075545 RepID=A0ABU2NCJ2_9PSEU|nr:hypothetical protein [Pseudonocardia sp. DSM 45834]MDT0351656.1 hypothetical protein [Pseudonocardia sp. DSM 45834]
MTDEAKEEDLQRECSTCGHPKVAHSVFSGCVRCKGDDWCDMFVAKVAE